MNDIPSVTVVIPSVGSDFLEDALSSVENQTYENLKIHIFCDGPKHFSKVMYIADSVNTVDVLITNLAENVGKVDGQNFYGHRIYAASPHLTNSDYVFFLDEDNYYEKTHVQSLVDLCEKYKLDFSFSFRKIVDKNRVYLCDDLCESLGMWPIYGNSLNGYLVDTSSYCMRRSFLIQTGYLWHYGWGGDRRWFNIMRERGPDYVKYGTTARPTLNYRLEGNENSVKIDFFRNGNWKANPLNFKERMNIEH